MECATLTPPSHRGPSGAFGASNRSAGAHVDGVVGVGRFWSPAADLGSLRGPGVGLRKAPQLPETGTDIGQCQDEAVPVEGGVGVGPGESTVDVGSLLCWWECLGRASRFGEAVSEDGQRQGETGQT